MAKTKKKNSAKMYNGKLIYIMMALFLAVYIPSIYNMICGKSINTGYISIGDIEESINTKGYIIRDETLIIAPYTGKYLKDVDEGEKIQANQRIAKVLKDGDEDILKSIKKIEFDILEAKRDKVNSKDFFDTDIMKIDKEIEKKINVLVEETNESNYANYNKIKNEIDNLMNKKNEIIGKDATIDTYIENKMIEKEHLENKIKTNEREVYSKKAGTISFCVDGYENILNSNSISKLDCKFFEKNSFKNINRDIDSLIIRANTPFVKVINGIDAYVVAVLDKDSAEKFNKNSRIQVRLNDINRIVDGQIVQKKDGGKNVLIVVKINKALQYLTAYRICDIDLISNSYSGFKVLRKSLKDYDEYSKFAQIGIVKSNKVVYKDVKVLGYNKEFAIIENNPLELEQSIKLFDEFILDPKNVMEGQIINKT